MRKILSIILLLFAFGCWSGEHEVKIDVLSDNEFIMNGVEYSIDNFEEVYRSTTKSLVGDSNRQYDIILRVHKGVKMKTLQRMKVEFSKSKKNIDEIKYSHEK